MSETAIQNVTIIGSGPAGYTAALYAARATLQPLLFAGTSPNLPGGQLMITSEVENFPGFPKGVLGPELMQLFQEQAERFGTKIRNENIVEVNFSKRPFEITTEEGEIVQTRSVIIATGANAKLLGIPREKELMSQGAGVSACATCDGAFYRNVDVAVVGGGDSAMEEALFLTRFARTVTLIHRRSEFRASKIMLDRAQSHEKIRFITDTTIEEILTSPTPPLNTDAVSGLRLKNNATQTLSELAIQGLFVAIGHAPNTQLFPKWLKLDQKGYIVTKEKSSLTDIPGVFACGDVQDSYYRQAITAAGSGCMAAIDAERFLEKEGH